MTIAPLAGLKVVDLSSWIAGAYCTKLLADGGAHVAKIEAAGGDPLRRWSASGAPIADGANGALFNFLAAGKETLVVDLAADDAALAAVQDLLAAADAVVWSRGLRTAPTIADHPSLQPGELRRTHPHLSVTAISPFGLEGPWADRPATEFTLQAWSGGVVGIGRGSVAHAPTYVGGQVGEWLTGLFAGIGTLASLRRATGPDRAGELVDVSMLEAMTMTMTYYPVTSLEQLGYPMRKKRSVPTPGVAAAADGLVGLGCGTGQQWLDFCAMIGHPEWQDDKSLFLNRNGLAPTIDAWVAEHTVAEVLDIASAFRIPNAPIVNGANAPTYEHFKQRETFVPNPIDGVLNPRPPYRVSTSPVPAAVAQAAATQAAATQAAAADGGRGRLPFSGLRILDMTAYWAGPLVGSVLGMLGAEVIHLESAKRPDGARLVGGVPQSTEQYWELSPIFASLNTNKKSLAVDLSSARGHELVRELVATCDAVVENFTPRVLTQLGLEYDELRAVKPDLVMVRMPGFGLDGPWRDLAAFGFVIEDASGLTWQTGHPDQLPNEPYTIGDPNAGLHALYGLMLALEHRDRTGEGSLVESAMVDAALNITAEQVIEQSAYGVLLSRTGNRGPLAAPQNIYHASGPDDWGKDDSWVALAVETDDQWEALRTVLGEPEWSTDPALKSHEGRLAAHDQIDDALGEWCRSRTAEEIIEVLWPAGVPVGKVIQPHHQPDLEQLADRRFFEEMEHPVAPRSRYSTLPMRFSRGPERLHQRPAPLLGEHNVELLTELGLSAEEIEKLEADGIIGRSLTPAGGY